MIIDSRPAAVAGTFYPDAPSALEGCVRELLDSAPRIPLPPPKAIVAPHAGYIYSGPVAASIYAPLRRLHETVSRVVLLGPTHRVAIDAIAVPGCRAFSTPLGDVPIDRAALATLADLPQVRTDDAAHAQEHSLEVHLPFLIETLDRFTLIPLAVGHVAPSAVAAVIDRLWGGAETLIVVSSDLSHYLPYATACQVDRETVRAIVALETVTDPHRACGATAINGLLQVARQRGLQARLIDLRNSGDTAGDKSRVVGYASIAFYAPPAEESPHVE